MGDKLLLKLNIYGKPIANKYCEGKMKRTLKRGSKDLKPLRRKQLKSNYLVTWMLCKCRSVASGVLNRACWWSDNGSLRLCRSQKAKWGLNVGIIFWDAPVYWRPGEKLHSGLRVLREILPKWLQLARLETRTKESIQYASVRVEKPERIPKGSIRCNLAIVQHRPTLILRRRVRVRAYLIGPERWWTTLEWGEARGNSGGSSKHYWRANRLSNLSVGAKD